MSVEKYSYSVSVDFPAGFDSDRMMTDIQGSAIVTALYRIAREGDVVDVWFKAPLSAGDEIVLDAVVAAHSGLPLPPEPTVVTTDELAPCGSPMIALNAPVEADGKPNFVPVPFSQGLYMLTTTKGDALGAGGEVLRGQGAKLLLKWDGSAEDETKEAEAVFHETIELHDGHVDFDPAIWDADDEWSILIRIPASVVTPSVGGTGDCNLFMAEQLTPWDSGVAYVQGDLVTHDFVNYACVAANTGEEPPNVVYWIPKLNVIIPAAGDGAFDLGEFSAIPYEGAGYWDYDFLEDELAPSGVGADWMIFDFQLEDLYLVRNSYCGSRLGFWELDAYKVEPIYPRWKLVFAASRIGCDSRPAAWIGGHFTCYRTTTT